MSVPNLSQPKTDPATRSALTETVPRAAAPSHSGSGGYRGALTGWAFWTAVAMLAGAALLHRPMAAWLGVIADKRPLPPRRPLSALTRDALSSYRFVRAETLSAETVEALGTREYLVWVLEDETRGSTDPLRFATLVVTYYTGGPELAVHRPEECYAASGLQPQDARNVVRVIESLKPELREVPLRAMTFSRQNLTEEDIHVIYTFFCNGRFTVSPVDIRLWTRDPSLYYAYFSKVEISFGDGQAGGGDRQQTLGRAIDGAAELLNALLPRLVGEVWPAEDQLRRSGEDQTS